MGFVTPLWRQFINQFIMVDTRGGRGKKYVGIISEEHPLHSLKVYRDEGLNSWYVDDQIISFSVWKEIRPFVKTVDPPYEPRVSVWLLIVASIPALYFVGMFLFTWYFWIRWVLFFFSK